MPLNLALKPATVLKLANSASENVYLAYGIPVAAVVLATAAKFALHGYISPGLAFITFYPAILLTTFFCGMRPGVLALVLSGIVSWFFFLPPYFTFDIGPRKFVALLSFLTVASIEIAIVGALNLAIFRLLSEEEKLRATSKELAAELTASKMLRKLGAISVSKESTVDQCLAAFLDAAIVIGTAEKGNIQVLEQTSGVLKLVAQRGFNEPFLTFFAEVRDNDSTCAAAMRSGDRIVVEDVTESPTLVGQTSLQVLLGAGVRAVQSTPLIASSGKLLGMISTHFGSPHKFGERELHFLDLLARQAANYLERKRAEIALRESEERQRLAVETRQMATWEWNIKTGEVSWNEEHYRMFGYEIGEVAPSPTAWAARVHPDDRGATEEAMKSAMRNHTDFAQTYRILLPDGKVRWCSSHGRILYDDGGGASRMIGLMEDITCRKRHEETQRILIGELQHRTRNLIGVVQAIAHQTMMTAATIDDFSSQFSHRLKALSRVQGLLSHSNQKPITVDALVGTELDALGAANEQIAFGGSNIVLRNRAVQTLALAIHELATNARKYGALASESGHLSVSWRIEDAPDRHLVLEWIERGITPPPAGENDPAHRGYGRKLIERALPYALAAQTRFELAADSLRCTISLPVSVDGNKEVVG